jgi:hypothetical protein
MTRETGSRAASNYRHIDRFSGSARPLTFAAMIGAGYMILVVILATVLYADAPIPEDLDIPWVGQAPSAPPSLPLSVPLPSPPS